MVIYHFVEILYLPPAHLPDLFAVVNSVMSCGMFGMFYLYLLYTLFYMKTVEKAKLE